MPATFPLLPAPYLFPSPPSPSPTCPCGVGFPSCPYHPLFCWSFPSFLCVCPYPALAPGQNWEAVVGGPTTIPVPPISPGPTFCLPIYLPPTCRCAFPSHPPLCILLCSICCFLTLHVPTTVPAVLQYAAFSALSFATVPGSAFFICIGFWFPTIYSHAFYYVIPIYTNIFPTSSHTPIALIPLFTGSAYTAHCIHFPFHFCTTTFTHYYLYTHHHLSAGVLHCTLHTHLQVYYFTHFVTTCLLVLLPTHTCFTCIDFYTTYTFSCSYTCTTLHTTTTRLPAACYLFTTHCLPHMPAVSSLPTILLPGFLLLYLYTHHWDHMPSTYHRTSLLLWFYPSTTFTAFTTPGFIPHYHYPTGGAWEEEEEIHGGTCLFPPPPSLPHSSFWEADGTYTHTVPTETPTCLPSVPLTPSPAPTPCLGLETPSHSPPHTTIPLLQERGDNSSLPFPYMDPLQ